MALETKNSNKVRKFLALKMKQFSEQRGQVAVIVGILIVSLLGMAAYVVDMGSIYSTRRGLQTAADAAALAGAQELPDTGLATFFANSVGSANIDSSAGEVISVTDVNSDLITVRAENPSLEMAFAPVLPGGPDNVDIIAEATAQIGSPGVIGPITEMGYLSDYANYIIPFGIERAYYSAWPKGVPIILGEDLLRLLEIPPRIPWIEFMPLDLDGSGSDPIEYAKRIRSGEDIPMSTLGTILVSPIDWFSSNMYGVSFEAARDRIIQKKNYQQDSYDDLVKDGSNDLDVPDSQFVICPLFEDWPVLTSDPVAIVGFAPFIIESVDVNNKVIVLIPLNKAIIMSDGVMTGLQPNGISIIRLTD